jgi:hypothetical protein
MRRIVNVPPYGPMGTPVDGPTVTVTVGQFKAVFTFDCQPRWGLVPPLVTRASGNLSAYDMDGTLLGPLGNQPVFLFVNDQGQIGLTTDANGNFVCDLTLPGTGAYRIHPRWNGLQ